MTSFEKPKAKAKKNTKKGEKGKVKEKSRKNSTLFANILEEDTNR